MYVCLQEVDEVIANIVVEFIDLHIKCSFPGGTGFCNKSLSGRFLRGVDSV